MKNPNDQIACLFDSPLCQAMAQVFDHLPDTYFFIKDRDSRFVHANQALLERLGLKHQSNFAGTTDHDRYPSHVADQLVAGDQVIMKSGRPLINHPEVLFSHSGKLEWFSTSKFPVPGSSGKAIGVVGVTRSYSDFRSARSSLHAAGKVIDYVSNNPTVPHRVATLARRFGISERQLHRQFLDYVKLSPREFILRSRIHSAAADLRNTDEPIASISEKYNFCDQSAFTRQFRKILGTTPALYRNPSPAETRFT